MINHKLSTDTRNYRRNLKNKNLHSVFSKIGLKMSMGRVPTKILGVSEFFIESLSKKFLRSGTTKIDDFEAISKCPKFLPTGKKRVF